MEVMLEVLAGKERGDEHAGDLVRGHLLPVRGAVPRLHEGLQHVVLLVFGWALLALMIFMKIALSFWPVPVPVGLDGQVREEHGDGLHSHVQEVELPVDLLEEILDLSAEKAPGRGVDDETSSCKMSTSPTHPSC